MGYRELRAHFAMVHDELTRDREAADANPVDAWLNEQRSRGLGKPPARRVVDGLPWLDPPSPN